MCGELVYSWYRLEFSSGWSNYLIKPEWRVCMWILLVISGLLMIYLTYVIFNPEKF
ncbi:K(+)-transporting ATPase subunit F [Alicyclobacillus sacchari]|uniref:K(+)-transporting ATPase subunit F n=1 Tax=Alicyclobacillus sacchari TaxID=392010 RepID=UPI001064B6D2